MQKEDDDSNIPTEEFKKIVVDNLFTLVNAVNELVNIDKKILKELEHHRKQGRI